MRLRRLRLTDLATTDEMLAVAGDLRALGEQLNTARWGDDGRFHSYHCDSLARYLEAEADRMLVNELRNPTHGV